MLIRVFTKWLTRLGTWNLKNLAAEWAKSWLERNTQYFCVCFALLGRTVFSQNVTLNGTFDRQHWSVLWFSYLSFSKFSIGALDPNLEVFRLSLSFSDNKSTVSVSPAIMIRIWVYRSFSLTKATWVISRKRKIVLAPNNTKNHLFWHFSQEPPISLHFAFWHLNRPKFSKLQL